MIRSFKNILVTGGAGFIGSNFIRYLFNQPLFVGNIINLDLLTYAANLSNLDDIQDKYGKSRYFFVHGDIANSELVRDIFRRYSIDAVVHFAAESHVDRSIHDPSAFLHTNVIGTQVLLGIAHDEWGKRTDVLFHHVSTDEVYGSLGESGFFTEQTAYNPRSPYSASKASADHLVMAYYYTYGLPITISNCSNNYGPYQFPEKLIPLMINNMKQRLPLPIYGDGKNIRDWLYVGDHCSAIWTIMQKGAIGEKYNIGGETEWENIRLVKELCEIYALQTGDNLQELLSLISFVRDRPDHDFRYAIDCSKIKDKLGWERSMDFRQGLEKTINWYLENPGWIANIISGEYKEWIKNNYYDRQDFR